MNTLGALWGRFTDFSKSPVKRGLESLGPRYCERAVFPLRAKLGARAFTLPWWFLTTANGMTTLGLMLSCLAAGMLLLGWKQLAFWLFLVSRAPDLIDGWIARHAPCGHESPILDSNTDKAGIAATLAALYWIITHPSMRAWVCIAALLALDLGNLSINLYHDWLARRRRWRDECPAAAHSGQARQAARNVMAKLAGKIKQWGWSFLVGSLFFIVAFPTLRSLGVWGLLWIAIVVTCVGALISLAGKVRDVRALIGSPRPQ